MYVHRDVPVIQRHVLERLIAQDAGVVDQNVHGAERADRTNLCDHAISGVAGNRAVALAAEVVHDHLRAAPRELQCVRSVGALFQLRCRSSNLVLRVLRVLRCSTDQVQLRDRLLVERDPAGRQVLPQMPLRRRAWNQQDIC